MKALSEKTLAKFLYLLFFIWPIIGLYYTFKYIHTTPGKVFYIFFFAIIGFTYTIGSTKFDTYAYIQWFHEQSILSYSEYWNEIINRFSLKNLKPEIFQYSLEFWVSRFTNNISVYFCILSTILGIAIVSVLTIVTDMYNKNKTLYGLIFIIFILVLLSPLRIASFRHYFAGLVFIYSAYKVIVFQDRKFILGIFSTVLIHMGFSIGVFLFLLYYFIGDRFWIYILLLSGCFVLSDSLISIMAENADIFSGEFQSKAAGYSYEGFIRETQNSQKGGLLVLKIFVDWTRYYFFFFTTFWYFKISEMDKGSKGLYSLSIVFFAFTVLTQEIIAISNRFSIIYFLICCVYFIRIFSLSRQRINSIFTACTYLILTLNIIVIGRQTASFINASILLPLLPVQLFLESKLLLIDVIDFFRS